MAKLKAILDSLDGVPEALHELYVEQDGKYVLDAEVESHPGVGALKRALDRERDNFKKLQGKIPDNFDPKDYESLLALREEVQMGKLTDKQREEVENVKRQLQDVHAKEQAKAKERISALEAALRREVITSRATAALAAAKGSVKLLLPHVERQASMIEEDGQFAPVVIDHKGHTRIGDKGEPMTLEELVSEMRASKDYASAFEGVGSSGGGAVRPAPASGGAATTVAAGDEQGFLSNLEGIAKGTVKVSPRSAG